MKFERFTDRARRVIVLAMAFARGAEDAQVGPEHIFRGLVAEREGMAALALASVGVNEGRVWLGKTGELQGTHLDFTDGAKKVLELSLRESLEAEAGYIGTEHLLAAWIRYAVIQTKGQ